jgi:hypothetical protein
VVLCKEKIIAAFVKQFRVLDRSWRFITGFKSPSLNLIQGPNNSTNTLKPSLCTTDINIAFPVLPGSPSDVTSSRVPMKLFIKFKSPLFLLSTSLVPLESGVLLMVLVTNQMSYKIPPKQNVILNRHYSCYVPRLYRLKVVCCWWF